MPEKVNLLKTIPGFSNYAITKDGGVWSKPRMCRIGMGRRKIGGVWLTPRISQGHLKVYLYPDSSTRGKGRYVHNLLLRAWVGPPSYGEECGHLDGNPLNNNLSNLCWGTRKENHADAIKHGTHSSLHQKKKLTPENVKLIYYDYHVRRKTSRNIGNEFGVSKTTVLNIINKKVWRHLWS